MLEHWNNIQVSGRATIVKTSTEQGENGSLRPAIAPAFPDVDLEAFVSLHVDLAQVARLRGSSAHDSAASNEREANNAQDLWTLVVGGRRAGFLERFYAALGLTGSSQGSAESVGS